MGYIPVSENVFVISSSHPSLPKYFAESQPNWTESSNPDMKWIEMTIKSWYRHLKRN